MGIPPATASTEHMPTGERALIDVLIRECNCGCSGRNPGSPDHVIGCGPQSLTVTFRKACNPSGEIGIEAIVGTAERDRSQGRECRWTRPTRVDRRRRQLFEYG